MTKDDAEQIAIRYIKAQAKQLGPELVILLDQTIERSFGWVFFYDSKRHHETGNVRDAIAGNAPIVVTRDGKVHETGTALPLDAYLAKFENLNLT